MRRSALVLALGLCLVLPLVAQEAPPTPRQALERAETLYAQGHRFSPEEFRALEDLRNQLAEGGDTDLAADLDLLRWGAAARARSQEAQGRAALTLTEDTEAWTEQERFDQDRGLWRGVRDGSLAVFTAATAAAVTLAVTNDRANRTLAVPLAVTTGVMVASLFPLLWGEARQ